jgi:DNA-binding IscR family transcriptional regulator
VYQRRASLRRPAVSGWREPEDITLLEVIEAVDGPTRGDVPDVGQDWAAAPARWLQQACDEAAALARQRLAKVTLAELARGKRKRLRPENVKE